MNQNEEAHHQDHSPKQALETPPAFPNLGEVIYGGWRAYLERPFHYSLTVFVGLGAIFLLNNLLELLLEYAHMQTGSDTHQLLVSNIVSLVINQWFLAGITVVFLLGLLGKPQPLSGVINGERRVEVMALLVLLFLVSSGIEATSRLLGNYLVLTYGWPWWTSVVAILLAVGISLWLYLRFVFTDFLYIEYQASMLESFRRSALLTQGATLRLLLYMIVLTLLGLSGILVLGVGILITMPAMILAHLYLYRKVVTWRTVAEADGTTWFVQNCRYVVMAAATLGALVLVAQSYVTLELLQYDPFQQFMPQEDLPVEGEVDLISTDVA